MGEDQVIGKQNLRPDLDFRKGKTLFFFYVTVPFDNGLDAFQEARRIKVDKYKELAE